MLKASKPLFLVVDLFCGAGGVSTGFAQAELEGNKVAKVIACINHDHKAIESHWKNHPEVKHFEEDIRTLDLTELIALVKYWRSIYPEALLILWASLECTNFSKAKGGQPRDADSRTLAEHLERYIAAINPDYVQIENVVEFMSWGPLGENGKPVSRKNGRDYMRWCKEIDDMGFRNQWNELNSANFGAFTSRNRLFGVFAKEDQPIAWPQATHSKNPTKFSMHGDLQKWKAVKEVLNFDDEGESIFNRKKPLVEPTLKRVLVGLQKYIPKGDRAFISKYYSGKPAGKNITVDGPAGTITTAGGNQALITTEFLTHYYGQGGQTSSVEDPAPVIPTKARTALVQTEFFIDKHYGIKAQNQSIDEPADTILPNDKHRLIEVAPFILNPSHGGHTTTTENPCPVIIARQDKAPLYLLKPIEGEFAIPVYEGDSEVLIEIKKFMVEYKLKDIKMRMLRVHELLQIQGFPDNYILEGNQSDQKKFIGNSVVPQVVKAWIEAMAMKVIDNRKKKAA